MNLYELVIPSDPISFYAEDEKDAYACAILIGNGKAGCKRIKGNTAIMLHTCVAFYERPDAIMIENLGTSLEYYVHHHKEEMSQVLKTFAYVKAEFRKEYDDVCNAIHSPDALQAFKLEHENSNRKTFHKLVQYAWKLSQIMHRIPEELAA